MITDVFFLGASEAQYQSYVYAFLFVEKENEEMILSSITVFQNYEENML